MTASQTLECVSATTGAAMRWLNRSRNVHSHWKKIGSDLFLRCGGDSDVARTLLASEIKARLIDKQPGATTPSPPTHDFLGIEPEDATPPHITSSNSGQVDWLYLADFLLLRCEADASGQRPKTRVAKRPMNGPFNPTSCESGSITLGQSSDDGPTSRTKHYSSNSPRESNRRRWPTSKKRGVSRRSARRTSSQRHRPKGRSC